jgi:hypothetical protein
MTDQPSKETWRRVVKALIAALALTFLIAVPMFTQGANAGERQVDIGVSARAP